MKRLFAISVALYIFLFVFSVSAFAKGEVISPTVTASPTAVMKLQKVEYTLPYPGMLPDNPLYFLKAGRDKLIEVLISNPLKKAEYYLLSSDKRLNTGYFLIIKDKDEKGVLYISKSNNYMHMAITNAQKAGEPGIGVLKTISIAIKKHEEIVTELQKQVDKKYRTELQNELKRLKQMTTLIKVK